MLKPFNTESCRLINRVYELTEGKFSKITPDFFTDNDPRPSFLADIKNVFVSSDGIICHQMEDSEKGKTLNASDFDAIETKSVLMINEQRDVRQIALDKDKSLGYLGLLQVPCLSGIEDKRFVYITLCRSVAATGPLTFFLIIKSAKNQGLDNYPKIICNFLNISEPFHFLDLFTCVRSLRLVLTKITPAFFTDNDPRPFDWDGTNYLVIAKTVDFQHQDDFNPWARCTGFDL